MPLQVLVKDSALVMQGGGLSTLMGFYDPCPGDDKQLRVRYRFHGALHEVTVGEADALRIPQRRHAIV